MMNAIEDLPRTIGGAREAHLRLMREWRDMEKETLLSRVRQLRRQLQETGERLGDLADRDEVQARIGLPRFQRLYGGSKEI